MKRSINKGRRRILPSGSAGTTPPSFQSSRFGRQPPPTLFMRLTIGKTKKSDEQWEVKPTVNEWKEP